MPVRGDVRPSRRRPVAVRPDRGEEAVNNADSRFYEVRCDGEAAGILVCEEIAHAAS